jgi:hypothetical protein
VAVDEYDRRSLTDVVVDEFDPSYLFYWHAGKGIPLL